MIVKEIELENFLSYKRLKLELPLGSVALIGENGAGKSSILDAILFALFRENSRGRVLKGLIRRGERRAKVRLVFQEYRDTYVVERELVDQGRRVLSEARLYKIENGDRKLLAVRSEIDKEIERILGIDKNIFLGSIYVRQGEIAQLIELRPSERKQFIARLLGIDELEKAYGEFRFLVGELEKDLKELTGKLLLKDNYEAELSEVTKRIDQAKNEVAASEKRIIVLRDELKEKRRRLEEIKQKRSMYEQLYREAEAVRARLHEIDSRINELSVKLDHSRRARQKATELEPSIEELRTLKELYEEYNELSRLKGELEVLQDELKRIRYNESRLSELAWTREEYERLHEEYTRLVGQMARKEELSVQRKQLEEDIRVLRNEYDRLHERLAKIRSVISDMIGESVAMESMASYISNLGPVVSRELKGVVEKMESLRREESSIAGVISEKRQLLEKIKASMERCPLCDNRLTSGRRTELIERYSGDIAMLDGKRKAVMAEIERLGTRKEELEEKMEAIAKVDLEELKHSILKLKELKRALDKKTVLLSSVKKRLEELRRVDNRLSSVKSKLEQISRLYREYVAAEEYLKGIKAGEIRTRIKEIEKMIRVLESRVKAYRVDEAKIKAKIDRLERLKEDYIRYVTIAEKEEEISKSLGELSLLRKELEERLSSTRMRLGELEPGIKEYENIEEQVSLLERRLVSLEQHVKELGKRLIEYKDRRKRLSELLEELRKIDKEAKELSGFIDLLKRIRESFGKDGIQKIIRQKALPLIQSYLGDFIRLFEFDFLDIRITEDYDLIIVDRNGERGVDSASGGEKVAVALALRLAIAKALAGTRLSLMMLDEPTQHLDEARRRYLIKALRRLFGGEGELFPQLILVTHDRELEEAADVVYLVEKIGSASRVRALSDQPIAMP